MITKETDFKLKLETVILPIFNTLKGEGNTSLLAIACAAALKKAGLTTEQALEVQQTYSENLHPDEELQIATRVVAKLFSRLRSEKFRDVLNAFDQPKEITGKEYATIFEMALEKLKPVFDNKNKMLLPSGELAQLATSVHSIGKGATVYSPFSGGCSIVPYLPNEVSLTIQEFFEETWAVGKLRLTAHGFDRDTKLIKRDPASEWKTNNYDHIISFPPFHLERGSYNSRKCSVSVDVTILENCLPAIDNGSKVVVAVPYWSLSSPDTFELRKRLIENDWIESVIYFPQEVYAGIAYPVALISLNKAKAYKEKIFFFNAEEMVAQNAFQRSVINVDRVLKVLKGAEAFDSAKFVSTAMVKKRDYHLNPSWHLLDIEFGLTEADNFVYLGSIATIVHDKHALDELSGGSLVKFKDLR